ncbi:hypothetical protein FRAHR75_1120023 [Frankia sp. Hr75.2]|nr:hypothetical protein FRAHR75_1120023 [Frankia sp. Hr75.2]
MDSTHCFADQTSRHTNGYLIGLFLNPQVLPGRTMCRSDTGWARDLVVSAMATPVLTAEMIFWRLPSIIDTRSGSARDRESRLRDVGQATVPRPVGPIWWGTVRREVWSA